MEVENEDARILLSLSLPLADSLSLLVREKEEGGIVSLFPFFSFCSTSFQSFFFSAPLASQRK